jgi:hypothetical protein
MFPSHTRGSIELSVSDSYCFTKCGTLDKSACLTRHELQCELFMCVTNAPSSEGGFIITDLPCAVPGDERLQGEADICRAKWYELHQQSFNRAGSFNTAGPRPDVSPAPVQRIKNNHFGCLPAPGTWEPCEAMAGLPCTAAHCSSSSWYACWTLTDMGPAGGTNFPGWNASQVAFSCVCERIPDVSPWTAKRTFHSCFFWELCWGGRGS